ncbi:MAG: peptide-methionine (S)-S-oxide reductase MsrA [Acidobacteriota bacterium]
MHDKPIAQAGIAVAARRFVAAAAIGAALAATAACRPAVMTASAAIPNPAVDEPPATSATDRTAVLAGGCFWGIEAVFEHVKGVRHVTSGYAGGAADTAHYELVGTGRTNHAESVNIIYDPAQVSYGQLLKVFFSVAHDPTELNRQGPDSGTQYRSAIFASSDEQRQVARAYIDQLNQARVFPRPIATEVVALQAFYQAEAYHQDFAARNPAHPYIATYDRPKVDHLRTQLPDLFVAR